MEFIPRFQPGDWTRCAGLATDSPTGLSPSSAILGFAQSFSGADLEVILVLRAHEVGPCRLLSSSARCCPKTGPFMTVLCVPGHSNCDPTLREREDPEWIREPLPVEAFLLAPTREPLATESLRLPEDEHKLRRLPLTAYHPHARRRRQSRRHNGPGVALPRSRGFTSGSNRRSSTLCR